MRRRLPIFLLFVFVSTGRAQQVEVPMETQVPILLKVLGFDRKVLDRGAEPLKIGILHQPRVRSSRSVFDAFMQAVESSGIRSVAGRTLQFVAIEIEDEADLRERLDADLDALYVAPLRAVRISAVTEITRRRRITTLTGVPDYVVAGLTVGLDIRGQRPEILVNLASQRAERADFSAQLLKMVRIVR